MLNIDLSVGWVGICLIMWVMVGGLCGSVNGGFLVVVFSMIMYVEEFLCG